MKRNPQSAELISARDIPLNAAQEGETARVEWHLVEAGAPLLV